LDSVAALRQEGKSERQIAEELEVSQMTVHRDLEKLTESSNDSVKLPDTIIGQDDREQPAKKPPKPFCTHCQGLQRKGLEPKKACPMCKELRGPSKPRAEKLDDKPGLKDAFGNDIPKRCRDAYCDPWIQKAIDFLGVTVAAFWKERLADGMAKRKKHFPFFESQDFIDGYGMAGTAIDDILNHLKENRPAGVCPKCKGEGCLDCKMCGLVPREVYKKLIKK